MGFSVEAEVAAAINTFQWHEGAYRELLHGPVVRDLVRRGIRVESQAKRNATNRPGPRVRTGRLRASITHRVGSDSIGPYIDIGSAVVYAPFVELGTSRMPAYPYLRPALAAGRL